MANNSNPTVIIEVDGEAYTLDCSEFTARECGVLKRIGNIRGLKDVSSALDAGDLEVVVALAVVAMQRVGALPNPDKLLDGKMGSVTIKALEASDPPAEAGQATSCKPGDSGTLQ